MSTLILLRHGQSTYNAQGKFTGTSDVPLTPLGEQQAAEASNYLNEIIIHKAFCSERIRAQHTLQILLKALNITTETTITKALNEQDFGDLEGVEKSKAEALFGIDKVMEWRRAYEAHPPRGERFIAVQTRVYSFYLAEIAPLLQQGQNILLVAHGNSLRALAISLLNIPLSEIPKFELQNAIPLHLNFPFSKPLYP